MTTAFQSAFRRLERARDAELAARAREAVSCDADWEAWIGELNRLHVTQPEREAVLAHAVAAAAGRARRPVEAARFRVVEGRGLQRSGSPAAAARVLARAARDLDARGEGLRAAQARVLRVDALAVAGRHAEALACADLARAGLRGAAARPWRVALEVNRANALRLAGDLRAAIRAYEGAARRADSLGDAHTAAIARTNAGVAWMDAGEAARAVGLLEQTLPVFEAAAQTDMSAEVRANLASAYVRAGRLGEGLATLDRLETEHRERGLRRRAALCAMDLADAYLRAGDRVAAEKKALEAAADFRAVDARAERVEALWVAAASVASSDPTRAASHLRRARGAAARTDRAGLALRCEVLLHDLAVRRGRRLDARKVAALRRRAERQGQAEIVAETRLLEGEAALRGERFERACEHFGAPSLRRAGRPWIRLAADTGLALAEAGSGRVGVALRRLRGVARFLDAVRGTLPGAWLRTSFVMERLDPYLARVDLLLRRGRSADRREAAALLDALAARRFEERARVRSEPSDARLEAVRSRLEALYDRLARGEGPMRGLSAVELRGLERSARDLERDVAGRWRAAERRSVAGHVVNTAAPAPLRLVPGVTAVFLWMHGGTLHGLTRGNQGRTHVARLGSRLEWENKLRRLAFDAARAQRSDAAADVVDRRLARLSRDLLEPLGADSWADDVWFVCGPDVPDVPLEMLPWEGRPLAAARRMWRVPAIGLRPAHSTRGRGSVVVALGERDLPGLAREVRRLSRRAETWAGPKATRARIAAALQTRDVVHLAGHGFDAPEAPALGGVRVADGWFGAGDVPAEVRARLVVLAACRTGAPRGAAGEAWGGLPRTLLAAGARWVLWTAADVEDDVTADLMARFHAGREKRSIPEAFGRALDHDEAPRRTRAGLLQFRLTGMPA